MTSTFTFCTTKASLVAALPVLQASPVLFVDCEGHQLGTRGGSLSLIGLRTSRSPRKAFIVDVLTIPKSALDPLFGLFKSASVQKVFFDGRMDHSALFHEYSVPVANVLDLQLADVASRTWRDGPGRQQARLSSYFSFVDISSRPEQYAKLHKLLSLRDAMTEHNISDAQTGFADHSQWMRRPLPSTALQYAVNDVYNISLLFDTLSREGYLGSSLPAQSLRYIRLWSDAAPRHGDKYRSHPILPLEILDTPTTNSPLITCSECCRSLRDVSFLQNPPSVLLPALRQCYVCDAIMRRSWRPSESSFTRRFIDDDLEDLIYGGDSNYSYSDDEWDWPETGRDFEGIPDSD
ncbi:ribonuclease H-like domain-containing protein [Mycena olivaceomarginata]|nr:ribonuclease H-like domain-containing protein [Mycena olivaceomarginata]